MPTKYPYQLQTREAREKAKINILNGYKTGKRKPVFLGEKRPEFSILIKNQYRSGQRKPIIMRGSDNPSWKGGQIEKECIKCGSKFKIYPYRIKENARFCSRKCANNVTLNMKGRHTGKIFNCEQCNKQFYRHPALIKQRVTRFCSSECWGNYLINYFEKDRSRHPRWNDGKTAQMLILRRSPMYKKWRDTVFKRDNYICQKCGDDRGGNLNADHIKPFAYFPELRFDINNGRTLCEDCHKTTITYRKYFGKHFPSELEPLLYFN